GDLGFGESVSLEVFGIELDALVAFRLAIPVQSSVVVFAPTPEQAAVLAKHLEDTQVIDGVSEEPTRPPPPDPRPAWSDPHLDHPPARAETPPCTEDLDRPIEVLQERTHADPIAPRGEGPEPEDSDATTSAMSVVKPPLLVRSRPPIDGTEVPT